MRKASSNPGSACATLERMGALIAVVVLTSLVALIVTADAQPRVGEPAPDVAGERWINSPPLTMNALRGRVVLVEFWTYG